MDKHPKFSIIVPVYNVRDYLGICIESIINQTLKDIEIICVNDGSTDDSLYILNEYAKRDYRIKVCDKTNGGSSSARNAGLDIAEGDYILFVDADDILEKNMCDRLYMEILQTGADIVVFGTKIFPKYVADRHAWLWDNLNVNLKHYEGDCTKALFKEKASKPFIWNKCYRNSIIQEMSIRFDTELALGEDNLFLFEIYPNAKQIVYIPDQLYKYRCERMGSLMQKSTCELEWRVEMHFHIIEKILNNWDENGIIDKNEEDLFSWIIFFIGNDLHNININKKMKKMQAKRVEELLLNYNCILQEQKIKEYAKNARNELMELTK